MYFSCLFSDTIPTSEAHAIERCGFPKWVAQNSARHGFLYCWREHLHSEFMFVLSVCLLSLDFLSHCEWLSQFIKLVFHLQNTLLVFTVSGIFKEGQCLMTNYALKIVLIYFMKKLHWFLFLICRVCFSVAVDGKSRESTMAFSRVYITVPAGNTGWV